MKRGAPDSEKMFQLASELGIQKWGAVGIMESLWQWAAKYAPTGTLKRSSFGITCKLIYWHGGVEKLWKALHSAGLVDQVGNDESVIHQWFEHCEDSVHMYLARHLLRFGSGQTPRMHRLPQGEREKLTAAFEELAAKEQEDCAHAVRTESAQPLPKPKPLPLPLPKPLPLTPSALENSSTTQRPGVAHENPGKVSENKNQTPKTKTPRIGEREFKRRIERRDFAPREAEIVLSAENRAFWQGVAGDESAPYAERELARDALARAGEPVVGRKPPGKEAPDREPGAAHG